jgi:hypothetical protein
MRAVIKDTGAATARTALTDTRRAAVAAARELRATAHAFRSAKITDFLRVRHDGGVVQLV